MTTVGSVPHKLVQIAAAHGEIILTLVDDAMMLLLQELRVFLVVSLLKLVLRGHTMTMKAVAAWRQTAG